MRTLSRRRLVPTGRGWDEAWPLLAILGGAALALLVPRTFGDPLSVDPNAWRLSGYFAGLALLTRLVPRLRPLASLATAFVVLAVPFSIWLAALAWTGPAPGFVGTANSLSRIAAAGVLELVLVLALAALYRWRCPPPAPDLRLGRLPGRRALVAAAAGSVLFLAVAFALPAPLLGREGVSLLALGPPNAFAYVVGCTATAVAQEVQFRGVLLAEFERRYPVGWALAVQAVVFGVAHLAIQYEGPAASFIPIVIGLGLLWGWLTRWTRSLLPAAVIHVVADLFITATILSGLYGL